ncbi:hypothetical protein CDAR_460311 [Caerostris darwini]|uniref:Ribosomal protein S14 n=1 Tax=Caerostris darwini TaxID=1538125 RepID=A0AAV4RB29_9ARAC|nr:hypothetical protein CDAR_460311 [Caerostris darwini]
MEARRCVTKIMAIFQAGLSQTKWSSQRYLSGQWSLERSASPPRPSLYSREIGRLAKYPKSIHEKQLYLHRIASCLHSSEERGLLLGLKFGVVSQCNCDVRDKGVYLN